ncbi:MAG TPA: biopolymer transporter ExbD [Pseudomonadota bacterium]|jgi:biopolymer transport protein ExbD|nr:biopolymer transporter ExbD [Deltaproteobacteria bacterium]HPH25876.1 biopolymer transporter ExbD [Pseudomonadota bacterium]
MAGGSSGGFGDDDGPGMIADINVTPLVDITLVLLIIMMVAAPIIANNPSIKVELPKAASSDETQKSTLSLTLSKKQGGQAGFDLYVNGDKMDETKARGIISDLVGKNKDIQAVIAGDKGIAYGDVMHIVDLVKVLGVTKFAMATDGT